MKRRDEVLVGMFVTVAVTILIVGIIWLTRGGLSQGYPLYARFPWGQNLKAGHPVLLAGQTIGSVKSVELDRRGALDVTLRINDDVRVPKEAEASVIPVGIFGDVAIAFKLKLPVSAASYAEGDTVKIGPPPADMNAILGRADSLMQTVSRLTTSIEKDLVAAGGLRDLRRMLANTVTLSAQVQTVMANQDRNLSAMFADFRRTTARLSSLIDSAMVDSTVRNVRTTTANMARLIAQVDSTNSDMRVLLSKASSGTGSVAMLLNDTTLYVNVRNLVARADSLLADFKKDPKKYINVRITVF
jgi:phospholipid/cholesterol/gamma-HCH transport system substrate-binding protein